MATSGKVICPICESTSSRPDFGREDFRRSAPTTIPFSNDPEVSRRRSNARAIRQANLARSR